MTSDENDLIKAEAARYKRATDAAAKSRATLTDLVLDALRDPNAKPADIARRAEWTPAYVRKLARDNGIQADPAYQARTQKARERLLAEAGTGITSASPEVTTPVPPAGPPSWLRNFPAIAELSQDEARDRAGQLELDRPEWFRENRRDCLAEPPWVNHAMLAADANDPAEQEGDIPETVTANPDRTTVD